MKQNFKKVLCALTGLCLFSAFSTGGLDMQTASAQTMGTNTVKAQSINEERCFYETSVDSATFHMENISSNAVLCVYDGLGDIIDATIAYSINENEIVFSGLDWERVELGEEYILKITSGAETTELPFMYVTKALRSIEDLSILDIDKADKIITGYYVLANDIDAGYEKRVLEHEGYKGSNKTCGFAGTFDGLGHSLTFLVGNSESSNRYGLFGCLRGGAIIKNTAFVDIMTNSSAILAQASNASYGKQIYVKDCYFSVFKGQMCGGAILENGQLWVNLENVMINWEGVEFDVKTTGRTYAGAIFGKYLDRGHLSSDSMMNNVYVISKAPLAFYHESRYEGPMNSSQFYAFYAGNDNATQDAINGIYKFNRVKRYATGAEMAKANNSYSSFDGKYWDLTAGIPVFKSAISSACGVAINGELVKRKVLYTSAGNGEYTHSVTITPSLLGAPLKNIETSYEVLEGANCITIQNGGLITGVSEGKAKIKVAYTFNGEVYEETITITVKELVLSSSSSSSNSSNKEENSSTTSGCSSNLFIGNSGVFLALFVGIFSVYFKRKEKK